MRAEARWVRLSARKARVVLANIRGRSVPEARTILAFTQRAAAIEIEKVLRSAVANAETNPLLHWNGDDLVISATYADEGPTLKRWRARARGRVNRIRKRTCHITVIVSRYTPAQLAQLRTADTQSVTGSRAGSTGRGTGCVAVDTAGAARNADIAGGGTSTGSGGTAGRGRALVSTVNRGKS